MTPAWRAVRRLALLPVVVALAGLFAPSQWLGGDAGLLWTAAILGSTVFVLRRWPFRAPQLATAGLVVLGIAGLVIAVFWNNSHLSGGAFLRYAAVLVSTQNTANLAALQGLAFLALGTWLVPQTFPLARRMLGLAPDAELARRVQRLTETRAVAVDTASADLRRLERDLHDGAQARLVALGMTLRAAERLIPTKPDAAAALVAEARETSVRALHELRELVRGVLPPVLADRGLADAVRALALDSPLTSPLTSTCLAGGRAGGDRLLFRRRRSAHQRRQALGRAGGANRDLACRPADADRGHRLRPGRR